MAVVYLRSRSGKVVPMTKLVGAKVFFDRGAVLRLTYSDRLPQDTRLTAQQLQGLANDAVSVLLSHYEVRNRD